MALYNFCVIQELIWVNGKLIKNYVGDVIDFKSSTPRYELVLYKFDEENKGKVIFLQIIALKVDLSSFLFGNYYIPLL